MYVAIKKGIYVTCTSDFFKKSAAIFACTDLGNVYNVGLPRNDVLLKTTNILETLHLNIYSKIIIWMPTFRKTNRQFNDGKPSEFGVPCIKEIDLFEINQILIKKNIALVIKLHPWAADRMCDLTPYSNIILLKNDELQGYPLYSLVGSADALITDYSSVAVDYLLLDKPICFAIDDLHEYCKTRNINKQALNDFKWGFLANDKNDIISFIVDVSSDIDAKREIRNEMKSLFFEYPDDKCCDRLYSLVFGKIKK